MSYCTSYYCYTILLFLEHVDVAGVTWRSESNITSLGYKLFAQ